MMTIIEKLKTLDVNRVDLDECITLSALAKMLRHEYEYFGAEPPAWLDTRIRTLARDIRARQHDYLEKRLAEAKARLEALKPADQRRAELEAEVKALTERVQIN